MRPGKSRLAVILGKSCTCPRLHLHTVPSRSKLDVAFLLVQGEEYLQCVITNDSSCIPILKLTGLH